MSSDAGKGQQSVYERCVLHEEPLDFAEREWRDYARTIVEPNKCPHRERGEYARRSRKRGKT